MKLTVTSAHWWLIAALAAGAFPTDRVGPGIARGDDVRPARARGDDNLMTQKPEIAPSVPIGRTPDDARPAADADPPAPRDAFHLLPGFQVERLFSVPKETCGSWVAMTVDPKGRIIASDQAATGLYRVTPPPIGSSDPTRVERLDVKISSAQGLLFAFDSLYVTFNGSSGALFRLRDTDGDDQFDEVTKLKDIPGVGEHGPHALRLSPDGKQIFLVAGNHTQPPIEIKSDPPQRMGGVRSGQRHAVLGPGGRSRLSANWDEDLLLPRQWDTGGRAVGLMAPVGWIAATDPDGKEWEMLAVGFRNAYDLALNADGELFTYDADAEWEMGMPWYRPTYVAHATAGGEFGWRTGTGLWPTYRIDCLPAAVNMGSGSPVGLEFGYRTRFPAKYQRALFALDWTFGTIHAVHLAADGASYTGTREEFLSRTPLPLTDAAVGPDGALYFITGGRSTQSELYRVTYVGSESTAPVDARDTRFADLRALRQKTEAYLDPQEDPTEAAIDRIERLAHSDRHIRYAARVALERLPLGVWQERVLAASDPDSVIGGVVGLAHTAEPPAQRGLLAALDRLDYSQLTVRQQLDYLRALSLVFIRLGAPDAEAAARLAAMLDPYYPATSDPLNRELCDLLVFLKSPTVLAKTIALLKQPSALRPALPATPEPHLVSRSPTFGPDILAMMASPPDPQKIAYVFSLRNLRDGWTPQQRIFYFTWLRDEQENRSSESYRKLLDNIAREAYDNATDSDRLVVDAAGLHKPLKAPKLPLPVGPGQQYTVDELVTLSNARPTGRNFVAGKRAFAAARCIVCHRFDGNGGSTGPDLTQAAGRFNLRDLSESMVDPSKIVSDQYRATVIRTETGQQFIGRVIGENDDSITLLTDPEDSTRSVQVPKAEIESRTLSPTSLMPNNLLNTLNPNEVLDLLAYLLSRGNPQDPLFKP